MFFLLSGVRSGFIEMKKVLVPKEIGFHKNFYCCFQARNTGKKSEVSAFETFGVPQGCSVAAAQVTMWGQIPASLWWPGGLCYRIAGREAGDLVRGQQTASSGQSHGQ